MDNLASRSGRAYDEHYVIFWFFLRIVYTTQLVSTAQNAGMASLATQEMGLKTIAKNVHVNRPRRQRESKLV